MPFQFNLGFRSQITSKDLNDKFATLLGSNVLVSGFQVTPGSNGAVSISPGSAIIKGCGIIEPTETRTLTIPTSNVAGGETYNVYLEYIHGTDVAPTQCSVKCALTSVALPDTALVLATVFRPYQTTNVVADNITLEAVFRPLSEVSSMLEVMIGQFAGGGISLGTVQPASGWWFKVTG